MEIHIHVHEHADPTTLAAIEELTRRVDALTQLGESLMSKADEIKALLEAVDQRTTDLGNISTQIAAGLAEVASDLSALRDVIANGVSPSDAEAIAAKIAELQSKLTAASTTLQGQADQLTVLGQDPANPVPEPPAPPVTEEPAPPAEPV